MTAFDMPPGGGGTGGGGPGFAMRHTVNNNQNVAKVSKGLPRLEVRGPPARQGRKRSRAKLGTGRAKERPLI